MVFANGVEVSTMRTLRCTDVSVPMMTYMLTVLNCYLAILTRPAIFFAIRLCLVMFQTSVPVCAHGNWTTPHTFLLPTGGRFVCVCELCYQASEVSRLARQVRSARVRELLRECLTYL